MPRRPRGDTTQLATRIPAPLARAVRIQAVEDDVTYTTWIAEALETHLRRCRRAQGQTAAADPAGNAP